MLYKSIFSLRKPWQLPPLERILEEEKKEAEDRERELEEKQQNLERCVAEERAARKTEKEELAKLKVAFKEAKAEWLRESYCLV